MFLFTNPQNLARAFISSPPYCDKPKCVIIWYVLLLNFFDCFIFFYRLRLVLYHQSSHPKLTIHCKISTCMTWSPLWYYVVLEIRRCNRYNFLRLASLVMNYAPSFGLVRGSFLLSWVSLEALWWERGCLVCMLLRQCQWSGFRCSAHTWLEIGFGTIHLIFCAQEFLTETVM